jgi:hypothetical protein
MAFEKLTENQYYNLPINETETMYNLQNPDQEFLDFIRRQPQNLGFVPTNAAQNPAMVNYGITSLPEFDMANLPMYEKDDEQDQEYIDQVNQSSNKFGGIMDLLMGIAIPGYGLFKNIAKGGLEGLKGFNQKLRGSTFALSPTLSDYFKAKRMEKKAAIGADRPGDGGDRGSRRGDADIAGKDRGSFKTDDTAGFF